MEDPGTEVLMGTFTFWALVIGTPIFFLILFMLPEDAYGEEDIKVLSRSPIQPRSRTHVLVLGDIGRSPRMQYHALSIAKHGVAVDLIGYDDSPVHPSIVNHKYIKIQPISRIPSFLSSPSRALFPILAPLKALYQALSLWQALGHNTRPAKWLLVQNPPSIPVLAIAASICWLRKTKLVIDWHNTGHSILALKLTSSHPLVRIARFYERYWSGSALINFAVSNAMARMLKREFGIKNPVITVHDRPMGDFRPLAGDEKQEFLTRLAKEKPEVLGKEEVKELLAGRKRLVVSSTSWTADEDFGVLLDALTGYSKAVADGSVGQGARGGGLPGLVVVITGKGPLKEMYLGKVAKLKAEGKLTQAAVRTAWLSNADYASLLGAADLGVSLHTSSSGVDLPMKVVDMFGAGLPVVGWSMFEAWEELVKEGVNGRGFGSADELRTLLLQLFGGDGSKLAEIKKGALAEGQRGWDTEWNEKAGPAFGLTDAMIVEPK